MLPASKYLARHYYFSVMVIWTITLLLILVYNNDYQNFIEFLKSSNPLKPCKLENDELLLFDNSTPPNSLKVIAAIESEHPSIPFLYWTTHNKKEMQKSKNCAKFPSVLNLKYHNKYWQTFVKRNITFQLYNAYYDTRPTLTGGPVVRLLAMSNETDFKNQIIYCQVWYDDLLQPDITKATDFRSIWLLQWGKAVGHLFPFLFACPLKQSNQGLLVPKVVSLVANECETATNALRIHYEVPAYAWSNYTKPKFAICIKGMDFPYLDISARLVEWIELQFILGASKIFFYQLEMHPNVTKVLEYYKQRGLVDVRPITLPDGEPSLANLQHFLINEQIFKKRLNELIPYNDCFYRNIYRYEYISVQDIDEVLMPLGNLTNWSELMKRGAQIRPKECVNGYASYCLRHVYFSSPNNSAPYASDIPQFMHMLQHVVRNKSHVRPGYQIKCFHRTDLVVTLHNHLPRSWLKVCPSKEFDTNVAQLQHYIDTPNSNSTVIDKSIWRYKEKLLQRSLKALRVMGFIHNVVPGEDYS